MIATILPSSSNFHAVDYNERKVAQGKAELLQMTNFGFIGAVGKYTPDDLKQYLVEYSSRINKRILRPQFHLAISCRGDEYTTEQLVNFAHQYLKEMGYTEEGQPLLIYSHHDTANNHIHIVTSRVAPDGHKINHNHERIRSQQVINKLLGQDESQKVQQVLVQALQYRFVSLSQFKAILESDGYECFEKDDRLCVKRGGRILGTIMIESLTTKYSFPEETERKRKNQLNAILRKYHQMAATKEELKQIMKKRFGVDLIFFGSKDKPYGYMIIDHKNKVVYKGSEVLSMKQLLNFQSREERLEKIDMFIDAILEDNKKLSTYDLNTLLWRQFGSYVTKGRIAFRNERILLNENIRNTLRYNDKLRWLQSFSPINEVERDLLCKFGKIEDTEQISIVDASQKHLEITVNQLRSLFEDTEITDLRSSLFESGMSIFQTDSKTYCIDFHNHSIICMENYEFDTKLLKFGLNSHTKLLTERQTNIYINQDIVNSIANLLRHKAGSQDGNREWEVGGNSRYDDEKALIR
ncbi:MAG: relaxase/mobilization nuclease domain-containing protein [Bacteroides sp.]|jgi:hypothetical protein|nr:relaxase/mobilization nuclease domain-containing protein [Bacteroides sp.]